MFPFVKIYIALLLTGNLYFLGRSFVRQHVTPIGQSLAVIGNPRAYHSYPHHKKRKKILHSSTYISGTSQLSFLLIPTDSSST